MKPHGYGEHLLRLDLGWLERTRGGQVIARLGVAPFDPFDDEREREVGLVCRRDRHESATSCRIAAAVNQPVGGQRSGVDRALPE